MPQRHLEHQHVHEFGVETSDKGETKLEGMWLRNAGKQANQTKLFGDCTFIYLDTEALHISWRLQDLNVYSIYIALFYGARSTVTKMKIWTSHSMNGSWGWMIFPSTSSGRGTRGRRWQWGSDCFGHSVDRMAAVWIRKKNKPRLKPTKRWVDGDFFFFADCFFWWSDMWHGAPMNGRRYMGNCGYNPHKWPYKRVSVVITLYKWSCFTLLITGFWAHLARVESWNIFLMWLFLRWSISLYKSPMTKNPPVWSFGEYVFGTFFPNILIDQTKTCFNGVSWFPL